MKLNYNQFLAIVYADLFDYPLTFREADFWSINFVNGPKLINSKKYIEVRSGFYFLKGRRRIIGLRKLRGGISRKRYLKAVEIAERLKRIPTIEGIFLTGSVAMGNAKEEADIDLMIVAEPGTMWLTRLMVVFVLKVKGIYRGAGTGSNWATDSNLLHSDKICPNIFLDSKHLEIKERNLYTAHEVLQAKCLFDKGGVVKKWLEENRWTGKYLLNAYQSQKSKIKIQKSKSKVKSFGAHFWIFKFCLLPFELVAFVGQYLYMSRKITNEKVGLNYAFFHPENLSGKVLREFDKKLEILFIQ